MRPASHETTERIIIETKGEHTRTSMGAANNEYQHRNHPIYRSNDVHQNHHDRMFV